ncbi:ankyrin repeat domain-containing protein 2 isoform X1 [Alligator mississippiensis]|uniref:ankyrin repeat domain-containing protein 2 isoform X1 n=1 Tax=Alligator mississippiensis TaxID=8496 RepID=UPI002877B382|nr:ankyrin repeat domain-containing protein 2 isoform X1 [Alligator mississippiensis]
MAPSLGAEGVCAGFQSSSGQPPALVRMEVQELEDEKHRGALPLGIAVLKGQERVRRSSVDLRREIIDVGGIQHLIELRKQRRRRREERAATPEPAPEPEPEDLDAAVVPETFLRAAVRGQLRLVEKFLADGGSPDTCDEFHRTALHRASLEGHIEILEKLLEHGATVDFQDRLDCTAAHWACRGGHLAVVKLLQDHGANLNLVDKLLSTPLHVATRTGHADIAEHLIHVGVAINAVDRVGAVPAPWPRHAGGRGSGGHRAPLPGDVGAHGHRRGTRPCMTPRGSTATKSSRCCSSTGPTCWPRTWPGRPPWTWCSCGRRTRGRRWRPPSRAGWRWTRRRRHESGRRLQQ